MSGITPAPCSAVRSLVSSGSLYSVSVPASRACKYSSSGRSTSGTGQQCPPGRPWSGAPPTFAQTIFRRRPGQSAAGAVRRRSLPGAIWWIVFRRRRPRRGGRPGWVCPRASGLQAGPIVGEKPADQADRVNTFTPREAGMDGASFESVVVPGPRWAFLPPQARRRDYQCGGPRPRHHLRRARGERASSQAPTTPPSTGSTNGTGGCTRPCGSCNCRG